MEGLFFEGAGACIGNCEYGGPKSRRLVLSDVEPGSLAHALGLRSGDRLESVSGMVIDDLESSLRVYEILEHETVFDVRVKRGTQWLDFTYTFVQ